MSRKGIPGFLGYIFPGAGESAFPKNGPKGLGQGGGRCHLEAV